MTGARITCPRCALALSVSERAPRLISCPRCLSPLVNPASTAADPGTTAVVPVPVLPLDEQVGRDMRVGKWLLVALTALLGVALLLTLGSGDGRGALFVLLLLGGLGAFTFLFAGVRGSPPRADAGGPALPPPLPTADGRPMLEYGGARPLRPPASAAAVAAGFFSAVAVCAFGFIVLGATANFGGRSGPNYNALILAVVVAAVVFYIVLLVRNAGRWPGFGPGATAGLVLGLMALGPCAACYLLTLG